MVLGSKWGMVRVGVKVKLGLGLGTLHEVSIRFTFKSLQVVMI